MNVDARAMEEERQVYTRSHKRHHNVQNEDALHQDQKRRKTKSKPPRLVHYLKDSVLSCSDEDSRPPDLLPEVIVTRTKNTRDKHRKDTLVNSLCDDEQEFYGFETLDIELSGKAFQSLQKFSSVEQRSSRVEDIHVDNSDILQKLHNLSSRVETRKNISQAEIQKKWFQELQESQKKTVRRTSNCVVKLPRLLVSCSVRESVELHGDVRQCHKSKISCKKELEASCRSIDSKLETANSLTNQNKPCKVNNGNICTEATPHVELEGTGSESSCMYRMPNEVSTGKEYVEYMDGKLILAFETEADLDEFTKRDDEYRRDLLNFTPFVYIVPTKTNDITKIKGWRTKKFVVNSDEDTLNDDLEMNDELESLRNEQEALVRHLNSSSDDVENVYSIMNNVAGELLDSDDAHANEEGDRLLASYGYTKRCVDHNVNGVENSCVNERNIIQKETDLTECNLEKEKIPSVLSSYTYRKNRNDLDKCKSPFKIAGANVLPKLVYSDGNVSEKIKTNEEKQSTWVNLNFEIGIKETGDNNNSLEIGSKATSTKNSVLDASSELGNKDSIYSDKPNTCESQMDPRAPFISHDLDHYLSANPAPMVKFVAEVADSLNSSNEVSKLSKLQTKSKSLGGKPKIENISKNLHSKKKKEHELYQPCVAFSSSTESDSIPRVHYRLAAKALQICKCSIAVESRNKVKSVVNDDHGNSSYRSMSNRFRKSVYGNRKKKLNRLSHAMKIWGSRSVMEKKSLVIKKRTFMSEKSHRQTINGICKLSKKSETMKVRSNTIKSLPSKESRIPPQRESKKTGRHSERSKFLEAVKKVKAELVKRFVAVKECRIVMHTSVGEPLQGADVKQLHEIRGNTWDIDKQWADFAASVVTTSPGRVQRFRVHFTVPFETMLLSKLIHQQDIDAPSANNVTRQTPVEKSVKKEQTLTEEVTRVVEDLVNCVVNHEVQDLIMLPDPDYDSAKTHSSLTNKATAMSGKKKFVSIVRELQRLDVNFIEMDTNNEMEETVNDCERRCGKPYCTLGCICGSISAAGSVSGFTEHCRRVECMFECVCVQIKNDRIGTEKMGEGTDRPSIIPHSMVMRLQDESNRHLAKVQKQFKHTVIKAKDEMIVASVAGSSRRKREIKLPGRFKDSVLGKEFLAGDLKILSSSEDCDTLLEKDEEDMNLPPVKPKPLSVYEKFAIKECSVSLLRLRETFEIPLYCMVHEDYGCPCHTSVEKSREENTDSQMHSALRNVAKKSTAMSGMVSSRKTECKSGVGNLPGCSESEEKSKALKKHVVKDKKGNKFLQKVKNVIAVHQEGEVKSKDNSELFKIVSVGSMRVEDFESQNIPETFVSSISKSLPVMKTNDNIEVENFQATSINNILVTKVIHLRNIGEPLTKLETTDYCFNSIIKEEILHTYTLLNCITSNNTNARKELYIGHLNSVQNSYSLQNMFFWLYRTDKIPVTRVLTTLSDRRPNRNCAKLNDLEVTYNDTLPQFVKLIANGSAESTMKWKWVGVFVSDGLVYELIGAMTSVDQKRWYWKRHYDSAMLQCFLLRAGFDPFTNRYLTEPFYPFRWYMVRMNGSFTEAVVESVLFPYNRLHDLVERCRTEQIDYALHLKANVHFQRGGKCDWRYKFGVYGSAKYYDHIFIGPFDLEEPANVYLYKKLTNGTVVPLPRNERNCRWAYSTVNNLKTANQTCYSAKDAFPGSHKEAVFPSAMEQQESTDSASTSLLGNEEPMRYVSANAAGVFENVCIRPSSTPSCLTLGENKKHSESIQDIIEEMLNDRNLKSEDLSAASGADGTNVDRRTCATGGVAALTHTSKTSQSSMPKHSQQPEALMLVPSINSLGFINCTYQCSSIRLTHSDFEDSPSFSSVLAAGKWLNSFLKTKIRFVPGSLVLEWSILTISAKSSLQPLNLKLLQRGGYVLTQKGLKREKVRRHALNRIPLRVRKKTSLGYQFKVLASQLVGGKQMLPRRMLLKLAAKEIQEEMKKEEELDKLYSEVHEERQENVSRIFHLVKELSPVERREHLKELDQILQKQEPVITVDDDDDDDVNEESSSLCEPAFSDCSNSDDYVDTSDEENDDEGDDGDDDIVDDDDEDDGDDDDDVIMLESVSVADKRPQFKQRRDVTNNTGQRSTNAFNIIRVKDLNAPNPTAEDASSYLSGGMSDKGLVVEVISVEEEHEKTQQCSKYGRSDPDLSVIATSVVGNCGQSSAVSSSVSGISYKLSSVISPNRSRINLAIDESDIHKLEHSSDKKPSLLKPTLKTVNHLQRVVMNQHSHISSRDQSFKNKSQSVLRPADDRTSASIKLPNCVKLVPKLITTPQAGSTKLLPPLSCDKDGVARKPFSIVTVTSKEKEDVNKKPLVVVSPLRQNSPQSKEKDELTKKSVYIFSASAKSGSQGQEKDPVKKPLVIVSPLAQNCSQNKEKEDGAKKPVVMVSPLAQDKEKEDIIEQSLVLSPSQSKENDDMAKKPVVIVSPSQNSPQGSPDKTKMIHLLQSTSGSGLQAKIQGKMVKFQPVHDVCIVVNSSGQKTLIKGQPVGKNTLLKTLQLPVGVAPNRNLSSVPVSMAKGVAAAPDAATNTSWSDTAGVCAVDYPSESAVHVTNTSVSEPVKKTQKTGSLPSPAPCSPPDRKSTDSPILVIDE